MKASIKKMLTLTKNLASQALLPNIEMQINTIKITKGKRSWNN